MSVLSKRLSDLHFNLIADQYDSLRGKEIQRTLIKSVYSLNGKHESVLDLGIGTGLISTHLTRAGFDVIGLDHNKRMLEVACKKARSDGCSFVPILGSAESIPIKDSYLSIVISTNAIHHFKIMPHLREIVRVLKQRGHYLIFTRLKEQNRRSIWGKLFPEFGRKERRLFSIGTFKSINKIFEKLELISIKELKFRKNFSPGKLLEKARKKNYSTFEFYSRSEFDRALQKFENKLMEWDKPYYNSEICKVIFRRV